MLALVDYVPRTLTIDQFISNWVAHQIEVIQRRTRYRLAEAEKRAHIYRGLAKALDALDEVIALIRRSPDVDEARTGLIELLDIDERPGRRDPRHAAASPRGPRAPEDHRRARQARARDRRPRGHPGQRGPPASDRDRRAVRDRREVRHRPPFADHRGRRRPVDGGPDPRRGARRLDHPRRLRQADPRQPVPHPEARRQGRARRDPARRRRGGALHLHDQPPLAAVLHHGRPGLPHQGLQPARGCSRREGRPRRRPAVVPARRGHRPGARDPRLRAGALPRARDPQRPGQEDPPRRLQQPAPGRRHRDQLPRGRRRADRRRAGQQRRRHPARLPPWPGDPLQGRRRPAAADGSRDVRCHGHEVPRRRLGAVDVGHPRRPGRGGGGARGGRRERSRSTR